MNPLFIDWYQALRIRIDGEELKARWNAVEQLGQDLDLKQCLPLIRLAFQLPKENSQFRNEFGLKIQSIDATFNPRKAKLELVVLASAILYELIQLNPAVLLDQVTLAIACVNCQGVVTRDLRVQQDLTKKALTYQNERAVQIRILERQSFSWPDAITLDSDLDEALDEAEASIEVATPTNFRKPFEVLKNALKNQAKVIARQAYELKIQREETDILWWLAGRWSDDLEQPYSEAAAAAALIAGSELERLTTIIPGPRSVPGILDQVLAQVVSPKPKTKQSKTAPTVTIKDAVNALSRKQREAFVSRYNASDASDLCPINLAVRKSLETPSGKNWVLAYDSVSPLKASEGFQPLNLAMQTYQEFQLLRLTK